MNFVENNGKKVAAVLCVASAIPAVASIAAMETQPGWHGDSYVKKDATVAKGWENVNGQEYYFEEDGTVDEVVSEQASTAAVSSTVASTVENTVVQTTETAVQEENTRIEAEKAAAEQAAAEQAAAEAAAQQAAAEQAAAEQAAAEQAAAEQATAEQAAAEQAAAEQAAAGQTEATVQPAVVEATPTEAVEAQPVVSQPVVEETVVAQPEVSQPVVEQPAAPVQAEQTQPVADNSLGNRIADAAIQLYQSGTTNGWQCTEVATAALRAAGVSASVVWPDQYYAYGTATNNPQAGDLIYYNNGGRGVDHIAVYIGNGQAVHGNYNGQTVIAGAYLPWANTPNFIHVG